MHPPCQPHPLPLSHPPDLDTTGENTTSENFQLTSSDGPSSPSPASPRRRWVPKPLFPCSSAPSGPRVPLPPELHPLIHHDPLSLPASAHRLSPLSPPCAHLVKPQPRSNPPNQHLCPSNRPPLEQNTQPCQWSHPQFTMPTSLRGPYQDGCGRLPLLDTGFLSCPQTARVPSSSFTPR